MPIRIGRQTTADRIKLSDLCRRQIPADRSKVFAQLQLITRTYVLHRIEDAPDIDVEDLSVLFLGDFIQRGSGFDTGVVN